MASPPGRHRATRFRSATASQSGRLRLQDRHPRLKDVAPRVGFTYNVGGNNDLVIRGGSGLYFASPVSNVTYSPKVYSNLVTASFANDGRADFITNPTNGVTAEQFFSGAGEGAGAVAAHHRRRLQEPVHLAEQHRVPEADQHA